MNFKISELMAIYNAISDVLTYKEKSMTTKDKHDLNSVRSKIRAKLIEIDSYFSCPGVLKRDDTETE